MHLFHNAVRKKLKNALSLNETLSSWADVYNYCHQFFYDLFILPFEQNIIVYI